LKTSRFFESIGILSQRTDPTKATVCFPELVRSLGLYKVCLEAYLVLYPRSDYLHIGNNFETELAADLYAKDERILEYAVDTHYLLLEHQEG